MSTRLKPISPITQDDIEWALGYLEAATRAVGFDPQEFIEAEGERLGFDWQELHHHAAGDGKLAGAIHFGLLLAEAQRTRFVLDNYEADVNELKEAC